MAASKGSGQVTRADVAREAGVSTAVVSYVVNNGPRPVAAETADRVRAAMTALHYQPNLNARALKRGRSQTLGLVTVDSLNPFFIELSLAVEQAAALRGHRMLVAESHGDPDIEDQLVRELTGRRVDGLLLVSSFPRHDHGFSSDPTPNCVPRQSGPDARQAHDRAGCRCRRADCGASPDHCSQTCFRRSGDRSGQCDNP